jgi:hypothetical protein
MRTISRYASLAALLLCACTPQPSLPPAPPVGAAAPAPAQAPAPTLSESEVISRLNVLVNDTEPGSDAYAKLRDGLAPAAANAALEQELRWPVRQVLAFDPPRLRERWENRQKNLDAAAEKYAEHPPVDTGALEGGRIVRRLGPALYVVQVRGGEGVLLETTRKFKKNARIKGLFAVEKPLSRPDAKKGDLVEELADQPRTYGEISRREAKLLESRRAPVLAELKSLEGQRGELERDITRDLRSLDMLTRDVNAVVSPRLLDRAEPPAPAAFIRKVRRMAKNFSREQYYRYALPVTGRPKVDAQLLAFLEERRAEMQQLVKSTGVGRGRFRANADRIAFTAFTASPRLLSIRFDELKYTGGAHPNTTFESFVFDIATQARLTLGDIFTDEKAALAVLSELATRRMRLAIDGALDPEGLAPRAENFRVFVLDGADLVFTFPPYQVASYAQGTQSFRAPLCHPRLLPLLKPAFKAALAAR